MIGIGGAILLSLLAVVLRPRWTTLIAPIVLVPISYIALRYEWWGHGVGDGWQLLAVFVTLATGACCSVVILVR
jgi:hypothetical protein